MTPQTPAALRARADEVSRLVEAATPGPWSVDESCHPDIVEVGDGVVTGPVGARDIRLIAAAPTHARDLAATLAALADAQEEVGRLRASATAAAVVWLTCEPDCGWEEFNAEAEARDVFERSVDTLRDEAADDGWHEAAERTALYRCERVASLVLTQTVSWDDDTEAGEKCRADGWDFIARGDIVEHGSEIERLRSDVARLTAERNALRATVDRLRPVVEALAEGCDRCAEHATRGDVFCATRQRDILTDALGPASPGTWRDKAAALRALLATPDAVADERPRPALPEVPDGD